ncbi:hypothetical protein XI07_09555 [Bradyrhizobium sp. CCBAU 11445]|nr:hypothetical protein [Bradyrhizobium sp. CCBAU 11445]
MRRSSNGVTIVSPCLVELSRQALSVEQTIDGQRRDAASSFRAKKMLWARASQCGQPITHGRTRRSIRRTIFELLARRLEGHEVRCSFQDLIAQGVGKITELLGYSACELQKVEAGGQTLCEVVVSETEPNDIVATFAIIVSRAKQEIVAETNVAHLVCNLLWRSWMVSK